MGWVEKQTTIGELEQLGAILAIQDGNHGNDHPKATEYVERGIPFIMASDVCHDTINLEGAKKLPFERTEKLRVGFALPGDVLLTHKGSVGRVAIVPDVDPYIMLTPQVTYYRVNSAILDRGFLSHSFRSPQFQAQLDSDSAQSTRAYIGITAQRKLRIPFPPLPIQRRIAGILSAYDDLIEVNMRRIKALEEMSRRTYEEWFGKPGDIPTAKLAELAELVMGQSPKSDFYNARGDGMPFHQGVSNFGEFYPTHKLFSTVGNREAKKGDILFSVRAPVGRINVAPSSMIVGRGLAAIRSKNGRQAFLLSALKHEFSEEDKIGNGAIFKAVTKSDMQNIELPNPPDAELLTAEPIFASYWGQVGNLVNQNTNLRTQRDLLLPRLVSGAIDVSEAEAILPETAEVPAE
ncbi:restriction endonuclease subunit S [Hyphomonas sp.]|uniref:restriction endonuclease subunit S n=1 Tax=Hyphomonas sp. TaxID=87 RepID=UPI0025C6813F|nr:restriction endonuclease subunit S [Hyphomonas sp.]